MDDARTQQMLFMQLVIMFHAAGMQQLGKVKHPVTDKLEKDLPAAQNTIDLIAMLQEKTKGNVSDEESQLLTQVLQELRLVYVQESAA